jgi:hypothetical protein
VQSLTAQDVQNRLARILADLADDPEAQGVTMLEGVQLLAELERVVGPAVTAAMAEAHRRGHTLEEVGRVTGTSRQNVWNRLRRA